MIELRQLTPYDGRDVYDMLQTMPRDENGLINNVCGMSFDEYKSWLIKKQAESEQTGLVDGWKVPSTTYWLCVDGAPVGFGNVRRFLTEALRKTGGNIGYGIAPAQRGKGYGKLLLKLLLQKAREVGIEKALLTIRADNLPSLAVALANGGVVTEKTDERVWIWIDTKNAAD
ncbi:MAG: GNAT family N-acetyltransferase [Clostridia bacterium]|nr:GNAT family N-acetyltransferase [Clostridia bacterium]